MSFEQISYLAQIVASIGVVVSLIFVGLQIRQNTGQAGGSIEPGDAVARL